MVALSPDTTAWGCASPPKHSIIDKKVCLLCAVPLCRYKRRGEAGEGSAAVQPSQAERPAEEEGRGRWLTAAARAKTQQGTS